MAEALKDQYGTNIIKTIAGMTNAAFPGFEAERFIREAEEGYEALSLTERGRHISAGLFKHLPDDYPAAIAILIKSLGEELVKTERVGMAPFLYMPHVFFVSEYGLGHFEESMAAQYELTKRFTAEFSIRAFIQAYPEKTMARLTEWVTDDSVHVRRLVSEGTRPRLPWAQRLKEFQKDPAPVLELLERLKDDPEEYVRRSVANNINDISKDHPDLALKTVQRWMTNASPDRKRLIRHALRSLLKQGSVDAIALLGYDRSAPVDVSNIAISPQSVEFGGNVAFACDLLNTGGNALKAMIDFRVHFMKASGKTSPKVFKLTVADIPPGKTVRVKKSVSFAEKTTRKHYPGKHGLDLMINGTVFPLGAFDLTGPA